MIHLQRASQRDETLQIGEGEFDAVRMEPPGPGDVAPERAHDLFVEERQEAGAKPLEYNEAQRI